MPSAPTVLIAAIVMVFIVTRVLWLTRMPAFIDEALHIWRAQLTLQGDWFIGADHGKWLGMKIFAPMLALPLPHLLAARLGVVLFGLGTLAGTYAVGRELYSKPVAIGAIALYTALPYTLFYERTALVDPMIACLGVWGVFAAIRAVRTSEQRWAILLGVVLSLAVLIKLSALLLAVIPVLAVLILADKLSWRGAFRVVLPSLVLLALTGVFMTVAQFGIWQIEDKTLDTERVSVAALTLQNLRLVGRWFWQLYTPPVAVLAVISAAAALLDRHRWQAQFVLVVAAMMILPYVATGRTLYPRYFMPAHPFVVLLIAHFLSHAAEWVVARRGSRRPWQWALYGTSLLVTVVSVLQLDALLIADLPNAPLPPSVHEQFVSGWPSGYGVPEAAEFLLAEAEEHPTGINMVRFSYPEQPHQGLDVYLPPSVWIESYEVIAWDEEAVVQLRDLAAARTTFLVITTEQWLREPDLLTDLKMERIWTQQRPGSDSGIEIWQVEPEMREAGAAPDAGTL